MPDYRFDALTKRQLECLRLVIPHVKSKRIATILGLSEHTVNGHINAALSTLEISDRVSAAQALAAHEGTTGQQMTGQSLVVEPEPVVAPTGDTAIEVTAVPAGRIVKLGPWLRLGIIVGLTIAIIFSGVLLTVGGDVIYRHYRSAPPPFTVQP